MPSQPDELLPWLKVFERRVQGQQKWYAETQAFSPGYTAGNVNALAWVLGILNDTISQLEKEQKEDASTSPA